MFMIADLAHFIERAAASSVRLQVGFFYQLLERMPIMSRKAISEPSHSLDRERGFAGVITARKAGQVNEIDWNSLLLGKKVLSEQELADGKSSQWFLQMAK